MNTKENKQHLDHPFEPPDDQYLTPIARRARGSLQRPPFVEDESVRKIKVHAALNDENAFFKIAIKRAEKIGSESRFRF